MSTFWLIRALLRLGSLFRDSLLRLLPALVISTLIVSCTPLAPTPTPRADAWLVFLCQASDSPQEPHTVGYYQELFDRNQPDLLFNYFQNASNSKIDLSGSEVYGWFKMTPNTSTLAPTARNNTTQPNRSQTAQDCKAAGAASFVASGKTIDPNKYSGFIAVVNVPVDAGATGTSVIANANEPASFYAHEMLHVYGLDHSNVMSNDLSQDHSWELGADRVYNDCWDIMSYATCTYRFNTANHNEQGPELQIAYREKLGWVAPARVFVKDSADPSPNVVTLSPVSEPNQPGPLMAKILVPGGVKYVVEYRVPTGFDRAIPGRAVVIRELRNDGKTYLVTRQNGRIGWATGEQFTDSANFLSITVDATTAQSATITINPRFSSSASLGDVCGNKYVGEVRTCPAAAVCKSRVLGRTQTQTTDYYCQ